MEFQGIDVGMGIITYLYELIIINICQITVKISCCKSIKRRKNKERKKNTLTAIIASPSQLVSLGEKKDEIDSSDF